MSAENPNEANSRANMPPPGFTGAPEGAELERLVEIDKARSGGEVQQETRVNAERKTNGKHSQRVQLAVPDEQTRALQELGWVDGEGRVTTAGKANGISAEMLAGDDTPSPESAPSETASEEAEAKSDEPAEVDATPTLEDVAAEVGAEVAYEFATQLAEDPTLPVDESDAEFARLEDASLARAGQIANSLGIDEHLWPALSGWTRAQSNFGDAVLAMASGDESKLVGIFTAFQTELAARRASDAVAANTPKNDLL